MDFVKLGFLTVVAEISSHRGTLTSCFGEDVKCASLNAASDFYDAHFIEMNALSEVQVIQSARHFCDEFHVMDDKSLKVSRTIDVSQNISSEMLKKSLDSMK